MLGKRYIFARDVYGTQNVLQLFMATIKAKDMPTAECGIIEPPQMRNYFNYAWRLEDIKELCREHSDEIALDDLFLWLNGDKGLCEIWVRYIIDDDKFGYASMGDFFFFDDCMFVLTNDESMKDSHNEDGCYLFESEYGMPLRRPEKYICPVIFAGVRTPYKDELGDWVYTGDIVHIKYLHDRYIGKFARGKRRAEPNGENRQIKGMDVIGCVEAMPILQHDEEKDEPPVYAILLDNHCAPLSHSTRIDRMGTVFWGLERNVAEVSIMSLSHSMYGFTRDDYIRAKYTPNFGASWHGLALNTLGVEYNWRR